MFKRTIIAAVTAIGLIAATGGAALACDTETPPCVPSDAVAAYDEPDVLVTAAYDEPGVHHDAVYAPGAHHDAVPETFTDTPAKWWNWSPNDSQGPQDYVPGFPNDERGTWQGPHTDGGPMQDTIGTFQTGGGNSPFFHRNPATHVGNGDGVAAYDDPPVLVTAAYDEPSIHHDAVYTPGLHHDAIPAVVCDDAPLTVSPVSPILKNLCGVDHDHYGLPTSDNVIYTPNTSDKSITATAADGYVLTDLPDGYVLNEDGTATFAFNEDLFVGLPDRDAPCAAPELLSVTPSVTYTTSCEDGQPVVSFDNGDEVGLEYSYDGERYLTVRALALYKIVTDPNGLFALNEDGTATFDAATVLTGEECPTDTPTPTVTPTPTDTPTPVVNVVVSVTPTTAPAVNSELDSPDTLASTGSNGVGALALVAGLLALAGTALTVARRRYSR